MMQTFQMQVSLMRRLWRIKAAFADAFTIHHDLYTPFALVRRNPQKAGTVSFGRLSHILQIAKPGNFAQIIKAIVLLVAVFVVNVKQRFLTSYVKPRKTVSQSFLIVDSDCPIARVGWTAGALADKIRPTQMFFPDKLPSIRVVVKDISEMVNGNHEFHFTIGLAK
jgi:hypothetical protein